AVGWKPRWADRPQKKGFRDIFFVLVIGQEECPLRHALGALLPGIGYEQVRPVIVEVEWAGDEESGFDPPRLAPFEQIYRGDPGDFVGKCDCHSVTSNPSSAVSINVSLISPCWELL